MTERQFTFPATWEWMDERDRAIYFEMRRRANYFDELVAALEACSFQLGLLCLAHRDWNEACATAIDASEAVLTKVKDGQ